MGEWSISPTMQDWLNKLRCFLSNYVGKICISIWKCMYHFKSKPQNACIIKFHHSKWYINSRNTHWLTERDMERSIEGTCPLNVKHIFLLSYFNSSMTGIWYLYYYSKMLKIYFQSLFKNNWGIATREYVNLSLSDFQFEQYLIK